MNFDEFQLIGQVEQVTPRKYLRFGLVRDDQGGEADLSWNLFNCMRYDSCFFGRQTDVEVIGGHLLQQNDMGTVVPLVVKYCFSKKEWPFDSHVWPGSHYDVEEITHEDLVVLGQVASIVPNVSKLPKPLTHRSVLAYEGTVDNVLRIMYTNLAFPNREADATEINQCIYTPGKVIKVELATFIPNPKGTPHKWRRPSSEIVMM